MLQELFAEVWVRGLRCEWVFLKSKVLSSLYSTSAACYTTGMTKSDKSKTGRPAASRDDDLDSKVKAAHAHDSAVTELQNKVEELTEQLKRHTDVAV